MIDGIFINSETCTSGGVLTTDFSDHFAPLAVIKIKLKKKKKSKNEDAVYNCQVKYFDTFNEGNEVVLNGNIEVITNNLNSTIYILGLISPTKRDNPIWSQLYSIRKNIKL